MFSSKARHQKEKGEKPALFSIYSNIHHKSDVLELWRVGGPNKVYYLSWNLKDLLVVT